MRIPLPTAAATLWLGLSACNVFFPTGSVELGDETQTSGTDSTSACTESCSCDDDCSRVCADNCFIVCQGDSTCDITLEDGGTVECAPGSNCNVSCEGGDCEVTCEGACNLECGPNAGSCGWLSCDGERSQCGTRGLACGSNCP